MSDTDWGQWADTDIPCDANNDELTYRSMATIDLLNDYELMKIFSYFKLKERLVLGGVCRKWRECVHTSFKSETSLDNDTLGVNSITVNLLCLFIAKCPNVKHIGVNFIYDSKTEDSDEIRPSILATIASNCKQLQSIDLNVLFDTFEDDFEQEFIKYSEFFKTIKKLVSRSITENAINSVLDSPNLEIIDISGTDKISRPDFNRLGPKMKELNLCDSQVIDWTAIRSLCEGNGKNIKNLSIDVYDKKVLALICENLRELNELKICLYSDVCDIRLFSRLINLKTLEIETTESSQFSAQDFIGLVRALKDVHIKDLIIELSPNNNISVNDESLQEIRKNCFQIEKLVIRGANSLTGSGMYALAQMKNIRVLDLKDCLNVSDQIDIVITSSPLLRELILHNCSYITNSIVERFIVKAKSFPNEKFLLDVIDTNVNLENLSSKNEMPPNLKILVDQDDCKYSNCEHGWPAGFGSEISGPDDLEAMGLDYDFDLYEDNDEHDYYDDYEDDYGDGDHIMDDYYGY